MNNFRPIDRGTAFLLPPSVDEWLPEEWLAEPTKPGFPYCHFRHVGDENPYTMINLRHFCQG